MAVFGLTELHEDDALRAVRAAVEMRETLVLLNEDFEQRYGVVLATRTGINTGTVAGRASSPDRNFVAGDTANSAARLQQTAEPARSSSPSRRSGSSASRSRPSPWLRWSSRASRRRSRCTGCSRIGSRSDAALGWRPLSSAARTPSRSSSGRSSATVAEQGCRLVTVVGAPGIGKSRLAHEFVAGLGERATVLRGRCLPYGEGITFWPLAQMVKQAAGSARATGPTMRVAKLGGVAGARDDARTIAEAIARLTGLEETRGRRRGGLLGGAPTVREPGRREPLVAVARRRALGRGDAPRADRERGASHGVRPDPVALRQPAGSPRASPGLGPEPPARAPARP